MKREWLKDQRAVNALVACGLRPTLEEIGIGEFDEAASLKNQARDKPIIAELVEAYSIAMGNGVPFPAVVGFRKGDRVIILGGNHRYQAAKKVGFESIGCYIVKIDDEKIMDRIPKVLNVIEGRGLSRQERIASAVREINVYGVTTKDASAIYEISESAIREWQSSMRTAERLGRNNYTANLCRDNLVVLGRIENDNVLYQAAKIATRAKLTSTELDGIVKHIKSAPKTELAQLDALKEATKGFGCDTDSAASPARPAESAEKKKKFRHAMTSLENAIRGKRTYAELQITTPAEKAEFDERISELTDSLCSIKKRSSSTRREGNTA